MDYATILARKFEEQSFSVGDTYESIVSLDGSPIPTKAELEALWPVVQTEIQEEAQAKLDAKASAIAKLEALGLTVEEVSVAFGLEA